MLSDLSANDYASDYEEDDPQYDDDQMEDDNEQYVNFQFMNISDNEICEQVSGGVWAPIVGIPDAKLCSDENILRPSFSHVYENKDCRSLPFTTMKINEFEIPALLDSGSVFNMMRKDVVDKANIVAEEGLYTTGSGKGKTLGTTTMKVSLADRPPKPVLFTVVDQHLSKQYWDTRCYVKETSYV